MLISHSIYAKKTQHFYLDYYLAAQRSGWALRWHSTAQWYNAAGTEFQSQQTATIYICISKHMDELFLPSGKVPLYAWILPSTQPLRPQLHIFSNTPLYCFQKRLQSSPLRLQPAFHLNHAQTMRVNAHKEHKRSTKTTTTNCALYGPLRQ
eukprot:1160101-Pelagomonas_calceolata.AAC.4